MAAGYKWSQTSAMKYWAPLGDSQRTSFSERVVIFCLITQLTTYKICRISKGCNRDVEMATAGWCIWHNKTVNTFFFHMAC